MRSAETPVKTEACFDIPFPAESVWPVLSKTDWLNRAAGLPPVKYRIRAVPQGGTEVMASARFLGLTLEWEEKPFEWREPDFYRIERFFATGPIEQIVGGMEFQSQVGGTRVRTFSEVYPRNFRGRALAKWLLGPKAVSGINAMMRHVTDFLKGAEPNAFPNLAQVPLNSRALAAGLDRLRAMAQDHPLIPRLESFLRDSPDVELSHIRPFAVARSWKEDRWTILRFFLFATRAGLLDLSWEVLCPNCRASGAALTRALTDLTKESHCEVCQIRYDGEFDKSVELKFTVNPGIKNCREQIFCLAGPSSKPHVTEQFVIHARQSKRLTLPRDRGGLRILSPQVRQSLDVVHIPDGQQLVSEPDSFRLESSAETDSSGLEIRNPNAYSVVISVEKQAWSEDILTAARATNLQEFRDLFSHQVVSPAEQIVVGQQIILFTDLRGSTAMYCGIGDAPAYALVRDHFGVLRAAVGEQRGAIVKTIGDAVMAVFSDVEDALKAVSKMHLALAPIFSRHEQPAVRLKSSLHLGPCLAVNANDRLDYFGTTINLAARLVDCSGGGDLVVSDEFYARAETQHFIQEHRLEPTAAEMKFRGFDLPMKIWRIQLSAGVQSEAETVGSRSELTR